MSFFNKFQRFFNTHVTLDAFNKIFYESQKSPSSPFECTNENALYELYQTAYGDVDTSEFGNYKETIAYRLVKKVGSLPVQNWWFYNRFYYLIRSINWINEHNVGFSH